MEEGDAAVTIGKVDLVSSTKLRALVRKLEATRAEEPEFKALVFSQFTSFLGKFKRNPQYRKLTRRSHRAHLDQSWNQMAVSWDYAPLNVQADDDRRFDGSMSQAQRAATVDEFSKKSKEPVILLISLKAGGVGLNL